jgi:hypothetical protein
MNSVQQRYLDTLLLVIRCGRLNSWRTNPEPDAEPARRFFNLKGQCLEQVTAVFP